MIKVGIDSLCIDTSRYTLSLEELAKARGIDPLKYTEGLGQLFMSVPPPGEDIITLATNAAKQALKGQDTSDIEMLLFATESSIDQSKAAGIYVHHLLNLPEACRVVELKQACYSATAGLAMAIPYLQMHPNKKILLIAADIARYGLNTTGESSQGAGAIAMVLSANPRVLAFENEFAIATQHAMDFWRPNYLQEALVEGKYSSKLYLTMLEKTFSQYQQKSQRELADHAYVCYHTPVPRLVEKAHQQLCKNHAENYDANVALEQIAPTLTYGRQIGNSYTAALYVCLASLLDHAEDLTGKRIGFYSYGSGCVAEFFSGVVQENYRDALHTAYHQSLIAKRKKITYQQYAEFYTYRYCEDGNLQVIPEYDTGFYRLSKLENHQRIYNEVKADIKPLIRQQVTETDKKNFKVIAPGKLILSGEHAVIYGQPALAMAINRYVTATITPASSEQISFDFSNLAHRSELTLSALAALKQRIKNKYHRFIQGDFSIRRVLTKPFELAQYALSVLSETLNVASAPGMHIKVESNLPIGCGLGSSAATIVSVMHALTTYLNMPLSREAFFQLALDVENMQHGKSSGIDLQVAMQGGCLMMADNQITPRIIPNFPMYLVNTGAPLSHTGQCVEHVAPLFQSTSLADEFGAVTNAFDNALQKQSFADTKKAIQENHRLLKSIGVVPDKVQQFIRDIEKEQGSAKICGAGSINGDNAGAVLVMLEEVSALERLCEHYQYQMMPIAGELRGVHAA